MAESLLGLTPDGWRHMTLGEACALGGGDVQTGPFGSQLHASDYVADGVPSIMPVNIGDNRVVADGIARVPTADAERLARYRVRQGDIVYSRRGDVERRALITDEQDGWLCGTGCLRVRFGDGPIDPRYVSYYLGHTEVRAWIVRHAQGATMPNLNTSILSALPFVMPSMAEQRRIAGILGALDDKVELSRRLCETLEATAQALYESRFVDAGGSTTEDAEFGAVGELVRDQTDPQERPDLLFDHYSLPAFDGGRDPVREFGASIKSVKTLVPAGSVLVSKLNPAIDRVWLTDANPDAVSICSTEFLVLKPRPPVGRAFLYCLARSDSFRRSLTALATGTSNSHQRVRTDSLFEIRVPAPAASEAARFELVAGPLLMRAVSARSESRSLRNLRDALLPRLLSGESPLTQPVAQLVGTG